MSDQSESTQSHLFGSAGLDLSLGEGLCGQNDYLPGEAIVVGYIHGGTVTKSRVGLLLVRKSYYGYKWMYNPLFLAMNLPVASWGFISGVSILLVAPGAFLYRFFPNIPLLLTSVILAFFLSLAGVTAIIPVAILGLFLIHILRGYFETKVHVEINTRIGESVRASILSLGNLFTRLWTMFFLGFAGFALNSHVSLFLVLTATAIVFLMLGGYSFFFLRRFTAKGI